jgi:DNA-binding NtrC family response regulator
MMTGYCKEMTDLVEEALNNDAYTCIFKPLDIEKLLMLVEEILGRKKKAG